jgi:LuxR family maltose regulon positive regulatory protein/serine/threonine-protein kinase PknK
MVGATTRSEPSALRRLPPPLPTSLSTPSLDEGFVARERLIALLRAGRAKRLALIHAPAGFGKTTLAMQWQSVLRADGLPVAWLALNRDDNDAAWFLSRLIDAIRRVEPALAGELVAVLEEQSDDAQRFVLTELVNQIAEYRHPLAIVLDDWHLIEDRQTCAALDFLLDVGPPNLHLIVTSRTRAPAVTGLMVRNQVTEIDADQLRLDQHESASFLRDLNALPLDNEELHQLWSSTEGWAAALQLVTLSLRNSADPSSLISGFSGRHHSIGDYLAGNVLDALPPDLLDFLLTTSILERMCGDLAAAVSGQVRGQAVLEELERRDMFLRPLDSDREWFRYHHLFASYLRRRLERDRPERIVHLHRTASRWFADHGLLSEAVTHALAAGDETRALDLVERQAMSMVEHSRMATLLGLIKKLPQHRLPGRPGLQIAVAWANCLLQRPQPAQTALHHVRTALAGARDAEGREILGEVDVVQAAIDIYSDRIDRAGTLVSPYVQDDSHLRPWLVAVSCNIHTFVDIQCFEYEKARSRQQWANAFHATTRGPFAGVYGRCFAGIAAFAQLDLIASERLYQDALSLARDTAGLHSHAARLAGAMLGRLRYERGDVDASEEMLEECHELGAESGVAEFMIASYTILGRIRALRGDLEEAWSLLEEGRQVGRQLALPRLVAAVDHERVRLHLSLGQVGSAECVLAAQPKEIPPGRDGISMSIRHSQLAMRAQISAAHGDHDAALGLLSQIRSESAAVGWRYAEAAAGILIAVAHSQRGDNDAAVRAAVPVLVTGAATGLFRTITDAGPGLAKVLTSIRAAGRGGRWPEDLDPVPADYLSQLLATVHAETEGPSGGAADHHSSPTGLTPNDPLTAREIDILRLLERGLSNKEIARNLSVTINTVKWYLKSIYMKLGVARRGEAVSEARRRSILT